MERERRGNEAPRTITRELYWNYSYCSMVEVRRIDQGFRSWSLCKDLAFLGPQISILRGRLESLHLYLFAFTSGTKATLCFTPEVPTLVKSWRKHHWRQERNLPVASKSLGMCWWHHTMPVAPSTSSLSQLSFKVASEWKMTMRHTGSPNWPWVLLEWPHIGLTRRPLISAWGKYTSEMPCLPIEKDNNRRE